MRYNSETQEVTMTAAQAAALFGLMGAARHYAHMEMGDLSIRVGCAALLNLDSIDDDEAFDANPAELLSELEAELLSVFDGKGGVGGLLSATLKRGIANGNRTELRKAMG